MKYYPPFKMTVTDIPLLIISAVLSVVGLGLLIYWAKKDGFFKFLRTRHYWSLVLFVAAGILTWGGLILPVNIEGQSVNSKQWVALGFSICISGLWWLRYVYSISPNTELVEETEE